MEIALFFVAMLALWLFIRLDQKRFKDAKPLPLPRERMVGGLIPGHTLAWLPYAGCGAMCALGAILAAIDPLEPPFVGRWSALRALLHAIAGAYALSLAFVGGVALSVSVALHKYKQGARQRRSENAA